MSNYSSNLFEEKHDQSNEKIMQIFYLNKIKKIQKAYLNFKTNKSKMKNKNKSTTSIKYPLSENVNLNK